MAKVFARCVIGRYIRDDFYGKGDVFVMDESDADTYQVQIAGGWDSWRGEFVTLGPADDSEPIGPVPNYGT